MVGTRSRAIRRRLSDHDLRCSASDRRWFPARPAQHVHRRRNSGKGRRQSALATAHGRNGKRRVETCSAQASQVWKASLTCCAGRAGTCIRSEALHRVLTIGRLPRIAREHVPTNASAKEGLRKGLCFWIRVKSLVCNPRNNRTEPLGRRAGRDT